MVLTRHEPAKSRWRWICVFVYCGYEDTLRGAIVQGDRLRSILLVVRRPAAPRKAVLLLDAGPFMYFQSRFI